MIMILQWGSTIKVSIELPVATRHPRDMTDFFSIYIKEGGHPSPLHPPLMYPEKTYILGQSSDRPPKNCDKFFVAEYFGMTFGTLNDDTVQLQSHASAWIWHSACSLRMHIHIKPLKFTCNSRNDFNRNFIHRNSIINVFSSKWH